MPDTTDMIKDETERRRDEEAKRRSAQSLPSFHAPAQLSADDWRAAYEEALTRSEPVILKLPTWCDDRGWSLMNMFQGVLGPEGQINISFQYPGVVKAWHRHQHQTDFWLCFKGHLKVGVYRDADSRAWRAVIGEKHPCVVIIPPTLWHGAATVGPEPAGLLYYVTRAFNPANPDEERRAWDSIAGFQWEVEFK